MNVRKEMAEKKLANLARENEVASEKLTVTSNLYWFFAKLETYSFFLSAETGRCSTAVEEKGERISRNCGTPSVRYENSGAGKGRAKGEVNAQL